MLTNTLNPVISGKRAFYALNVVWLFLWEFNDDFNVIIYLWTRWVGFFRKENTEVSPAWLDASSNKSSIFLSRHHHPRRDFFLELHHSSRLNGASRVQMSSAAQAITAFFFIFFFWMYYNLVHILTWQKSRCLGSKVSPKRAIKWRK